MKGVFDKMSREQNKDRARKILAIALDMHQSKEVRMQAVRVLRVMGAIDELWTVVQNVKCPFTKQSAIDSIPALEVKVWTEQNSDPSSLPRNTEMKDEEKTSNDELKWP